MAARHLGIEHVTVVVPTFRRERGLARLLEGLARQEGPGVGWDVVVVDNDDPPGAEGVFAAHADRLPVPARLVREPARGASNARNRGIAEASGDVVAFIDDDVDPRPDWLRLLLVPLREGRAEGVGGRVLLDPSIPRPRWFNESVLGHYLAMLDLGEHETDIEPDRYVLTASAAFRTDLLRRIGGMDPALGPQDGRPLFNDDVLLCRRFMATGSRLRYVPDAIVTHDAPPARLRRGYILRRMYAQGRSDWVMDRRILTAHRLGGAVRQLLWLVDRMRKRVDEGALRRWTMYQAAYDLAYTAGFLRETAASLGRRPAAVGRDGVR